MSAPVSIRMILAALFQANESWHMSDEELEAYLLRSSECPQHIRSSLTNTSALSTKSRIRTWRSEWNRGLWQELENCRMFSFRYYNGVPVNRNCNPLAESEIKGSILSVPTDTRKDLYVSNFEGSEEKQDYLVPAN